MNLEVVSQIFASDIINWIFAAGGGAIAYLVLHRMQNTRERHAMIKEIEDSISRLMDQECAITWVDYKKDCLEKVNFRTILHDFSPWILFNKENVKIIDGQRYVLIRDDKEYYELVSTSLIHESLLWFRRVNKLYKDRIITSEDIADLWRQILPFMRANKLEFYRSYLGVDDTYAISTICLHCLYSIRKHNRLTAIKYASEIIKECENYDKYFEELSNKWLFEKMVLKEFRKEIMENN